MRLDWAEPGRRYRVTAVSPGVEAEARRAGLVPGTVLLVVATLSAGPVTVEDAAGRRAVAPAVARGLAVVLADGDGPAEP